MPFQVLEMQGSWIKRDMDSVERSLKSEKINVERKVFLFDLRENDRGRFLRITEDVRGRRDTIILPAPGLEDFRRSIGNMIVASEKAGPPPAAHEPPR